VSNSAIRSNRQRGHFHSYNDEVLCATVCVLQLGPIQGGPKMAVFVERLNFVKY